MPPCTIAGSVETLVAGFTAAEGLRAYLLLSSGVLLWLIGVVFPLISIACPRCKTRWLWLAATQPNLDWYRWLISQTQCPVCGLNPPAGK